jgi:outer membrane lipoprotein-sorting protein/peroxiredoxin
MSAFFDWRSDRGFLTAASSLLALAVMLTAGCSGCSQTSEARPQAQVIKPPQSAIEILKHVVELYHQANRYQDHGRLLVQYTCEGQVVHENYDFSFAASGPNKIRLRAYDVLVVCDGETFYATFDEAPDEVLSVPAPEELMPALVFRNQLLGKALNQVVGSIPMGLFLDPAPLQTLEFNAQQPRLETPEKIGPNTCYRVAIDRLEGAMVLWIDQQSFVVRRVEYPTDGYRRLREAYPGAISEMTVTAEIDDAQLDPPIDDAVFEFHVPPDAELVKDFDEVRLGARIPKFKLTTLDGRLLTRDSLADKVVVLKFWQTGDVLKYYDDLAAFEEVQKHFQGNDSVVFLAVSDDLDDASDDDLRAAFAKVKLSLPIARVAPDVATRSFALEIVPTTVVLGRDGTLQEHFVGVYPNQLHALKKNVDTLLADGTLVLEAPEQPQNLFYYGWPFWQAPKGEEVEPPAAANPFLKAEIAPKSEPEQLRRKHLWTCSDVIRPGNILAVRGDSGHDRLFVVHGSSKVIELEASGKVAAKHTLDLPEGDDAPITFLRTGTDGAGNRYFLGSKPGGQQVHLFDADWKRLVSFPDNPDHPPIADAVLADLTGDGKLKMFVGYLSAVGVHCVNLDGQRLWRNPAVENVLRLDVTGADRAGRRNLLVAQGLVLPIDAEGLEKPPVVLTDGFARLIYTADLAGDGSREWCAIALRSLGNGAFGSDMAVGFSSRGTALWKYLLPKGIHHHLAFEMVALGNLLATEFGQWVIAGADGSIHILDIDGQLIDRFNYGASPSGIAIANLAGQPALLVATDEGVEAWQFELP